MTKKAMAKGDLRLNYSANGNCGSRAYISVEGLAHSALYEVIPHTPL